MRTGVRKAGSDCYCPGSLLTLPVKFSADGNEAFHYGRYAQLYLERSSKELQIGSLSGVILWELIIFCKCILSIQYKLQYVFVYSKQVCNVV